MSDIAKVVMPPIYRLQFKGDRRRSSWGWHRVAELIIAVKNVLELEGLRDQRAIPRIGDFYWFSERTEKEEMKYPYATHTGELKYFDPSAFKESGWFEPYAAENLFLPAAVGTQIIKDIKSIPRVMMGIQH